MILYLLMALLALAAGGWLTRPWWGGAQLAQIDRRSANIAAYKTRLAEVESDLAGGLVDAQAAEQLRQELGARLVADAEGQVTAPAAAPPIRSYRAAGAAVALLAAFGAAAYWIQGSWRTHGMIELARSDPEAARQLSIDEMVSNLEMRLQKVPEDAEGWAILGHSKAMLGLHDAASEAYAKANALTEASNADWLVAEGEALALSRDRDLLGRPQQLFAIALARTPDHARGLWFAGLAAVQGEDYAAAQQYWTRLSQREDLPADLVESLRQRLAELARITGTALPETATAEAPAATLALRLKVTLGASLAGQTPPGNMLTVFAKAEAGPPMPLAVQRIQDAKFPVEVVLDDSMAMMPQLKLSQFERWVVTARIGGGGDVKARAGDWEGRRTIGREEAGQPLALQIDRVVE